MFTDELLKHCRYYHGEKENPYALSLLYWVWEFEKKWVEESKHAEVSPFFSEALSQLLRATGNSFDVGDGVPLYLRAAMFMLFLKGNELPRIEEFMKFYRDWKNGEVAR